MSRPNAAYATGDDRSASSRPDAFGIVEMEGKQAPSWRTVAAFDESTKPDATCKLFHGYAAARNAHVFACREGDGLLVLAWRGDAWTARRIAYPDERRTSAIRAGTGRYLVGNYGAKTPYTAFVRIDPTAASLKAEDVFAVPGDQSTCRFGLSAKGRHLANLTPDGRLRIYEISPAWKEVASFEAVPAFDCTYGAATPTPDLAVVGSRAFVSDPLNGRIREFDLETLKQGLDLPVEGKPTTLAGDAASG